MEAAQSTPERTRAPGSAALAPYQHRSLQERCLANAAKLALKSLATVAAAGAAGGDMAAVAQANRQGLLLRECQVGGTRWSCCWSVRGQAAVPGGVRAAHPAGPPNEQSNPPPSPSPADNPSQIAGVAAGSDHSSCHGCHS